MTGSCDEKHPGAYSVLTISPCISISPALLGWSDESQYPINGLTQ